MPSSDCKFIRDECLNMHWVMSIEHARNISEEDRTDSNNERPNSTLGNLTPAEFISLEEEKAAGVL
jgi:putative transposase